MSHTADHHDMDAHGSVFKRIWVPFFILFGLTVLEFAIAFTVDKGLGRNIVFIILTIVKAFYIVAYFMHLKFERVNLAYSIVLPALLLLYLIALLLIEGDYVSGLGY